MNYDEIQLGIGFDEGCTVIQLGSEAPIMSLDSNGHCDEEKELSVTYKDLGRSELFPQSLTHNNNGRFMLLYGDGEYSISTTRVLRSKCYGSAIEAVWSADGNGDFAIKEVPFIQDYGGKMLGARGSNFLVFYSWQSGDVIKKIDVTPNVSQGYAISCLECVLV